MSINNQVNGSITSLYSIFLFTFESTTRLDWDEHIRAKEKNALIDGKVLELGDNSIREKQTKIQSLFSAIDPDQKQKYGKQQIIDSSSSSNSSFVHHFDLIHSARYFGEKTKPFFPFVEKRLYYIYELYLFV